MFLVLLVRTKLVTVCLCGVGDVGLLSEDETSSSVSSGDTLVPGSPWERPSPKALKRRWKFAKQWQKENPVDVAKCFHEALDLMGLEDSKPCKLSVTSKLPPLGRPEWFNDVAASLMEKEPPFVGPQVT